MELDIEPDLDLIDEGLWLGNQTAASNVTLLKAKGITHVLSVDTEKVSCLNNEQVTDIRTLFICADDRPHVDLLSHFDEACRFIDDAVANGCCLVHCFFGVSRSATLVIAYLMRKHGLTFHNAVAKVKERRPVIGPNPGFLAQLQLYEKMSCKLDVTNSEFKLFRLENLVASLKKGRNYEHIKRVMAKDPGVPDGNVNIDLGKPLYRCKSCRRILFTSQNLLSHAVGQKPSWLDSTWLVGEESQTGPCTQGLFTEPVEWMYEDICALQGKLLCPKCKSKLGNFNWIGSACPCGARIIPAIHINSTKVDEHDATDPLEENA